MKTRKEIIIVGPRVLVTAEEGERKTSAGLYLPPTVRDKEEVTGGIIIKAGPGYPVPDTAHTDEPWTTSRSPSYVPLQAREGDYAIFLKKEAVEIEYEHKKYLIVPHSAILALVRTEITEE
jgi:co-chaperonin GroES (HSP10)